MKNIKLIFAIFLLTFSIGISGQTTGKASYYSNKLHKGATTSGIPYHKDSLTCAHKEFPFGTWVKVRNLKNDKEAFVKVTDRGPFVKGRIIDVSYAAAKKLGFVGQGVTSVEITNLGKNPKFPMDSVPTNILFTSDYSLKNKVNYISYNPLFLKFDNDIKANEISILRKSVNINK